MFKKFATVSAIAALLITLLAPASQAITDSTPTKNLVSTAWLKANLADPNLILVHVGDADNSVYVRSHIEGAQFIDWKKELANSEEDKLRYGVVTRSNFAKVVERLGITSKSTVVFYAEAAGVTRAAWAVWVSKIYGVPDARLLDGGLLKWTKEGGAVTIAAPAPKPAGSLNLLWPSQTKLRATIAEVIRNAKLKKAAQATIVDARATDAFVGKTPKTGLGDAAKAGHIASSANVPVSDLTNSDGTFKSADEIRTAYAKVGVTKNTKVILYCGTGHAAVASWFALTQIVGNNNVKNYDGSWFEFATKAPGDLVETN